LRAVKPVLEVLLAATKRGVTERDIAHAVVAGGACDPASVAFCLRDIQWALDVDSNSGPYPRYSIRHESIRAWLRDDANARALGLEEERGHALLAASLLQRSWPQQMFLSNWLLNTSGSALLSTAPSTPSGGAPWYQWSGWKPNKEDEDVYNCVTHLIRANRQSYANLVGLLKAIGLENLNSVHRGKTTALHSASVKGDVRGVKLLLEAGASTNISVRGRSPLHLAASKGFSETVGLLLSAGANVAAVTRSGRTALLFAVQRGSVSTVERILEFIQRWEESTEQGDTSERLSLVDVSQTDTGRTPLSFAAEEGHDEIVRLLLKARASVFLADRWGRTPLYYGRLLARDWRHPLY
jgi:Ankyrin repeats (many copies)/Ankyrin repeats (3 copies)